MMISSDLVTEILRGRVEGTAVRTTITTTMTRILITATTTTTTIIIIIIKATT